MSRKTKLETGLDSLFSTPKRKTRPATAPKSKTTRRSSKPVEPTFPAGPPPGTMPPVVLSPAPLSPAVTAPVIEVEEIKTPRSDDLDRQTPPALAVAATSAGEPIAVDGREKQFVIFTLANEHYGVDISAVNSIIKLQPITDVPGAARYVEGVTNLRGTVLPVMNLRQRLGLPEVEATKDTRIVVVNVNDVEIGLIVDVVIEVKRVPETAIEPPSPIVTMVESTFITGIAKADERLIVLLDLGKVLFTELNHIS